MNPDYTSDLKLVERYIVSYSLYLLTMFEKKVDTFTGSSCCRSKQEKMESHKDFLYEGNVLDD